VNSTLPPLCAAFVIASLTWVETVGGGAVTEIAPAAISDSLSASRHIGSILLSKLSRPENETCRGKFSLSQCGNLSEARISVAMSYISMASAGKGAQSDPKVTALA